jgi:hypothetical protein
MAEQQVVEGKNKHMRPRERARGQKYNVTSQRTHPYLNSLEATSVYIYG